MAYSSLTFLVFLFAVIVVYYLVPKRYQWFVLLVASYGFYLSSGVAHVVYILFTTLFSYGAGRWMQKVRTEYQEKADALGDAATKEQKRELKKESSRKVHRIQVATVLVNLAILAYVKYLNDFIGGFNVLFGMFHWDASIPYVNLIVPLGLSYYTFNSVGYLIDVGRGKLAPAYAVLAHLRDARVLAPGAAQVAAIAAQGEDRRPGLPAGQWLLLDGVDGKRGNAPVARGHDGAAHVAPGAARPHLARGEPTPTKARGAAWHTVTQYVCAAHR